MKREMHGMTGTRPYHIYRNMRNRCVNKNHTSYKNYGGRGIKICERWINSFIYFREDMKEGYKDTLTIDRIDNDGNYCKENCRWATWKQQQINKRNKERGIIKIPSKKEIIDLGFCLKDRCKDLGLPYNVIYQRIRNGWSVENAFNKKIVFKTKYKHRKIK